MKSYCCWKHGITVETGGHGDRTFRGQDLIVVSPGVRSMRRQLVQARTWERRSSAKSNSLRNFCPVRSSPSPEPTAKPPLPHWPAKIIAAGKFSTVVGGNIWYAGYQLGGSGRAATWTVLEVSSFQLETIVEFRPRIAGDSEHHARPS